MDRQEASEILTKELKSRASAYYDHLQSDGKSDYNEERYLDALDVAVKVLLWANIQPGGD